jgi:tRNA-2-methylthio-N6-dimethylallyladenosine synthase
VASTFNNTPLLCVAPAAAMQVADLIKADRLNRLNAVVMEVATERSQRFAGRTLEVLVEGVNPRDPSQAFGRLRHNKLVYFDGDGEALRGQLVDVKIDQCNAYSLFGDMVGVVPPRAPLAGGVVAGSSSPQAVAALASR